MKQQLQINATQGGQGMFAIQRGKLPSCLARPICSQG